MVAIAHYAQFFYLFIFLQAEGKGAAGDAQEPP